MAKLGDIATYINGYAFKPQDWSDEGIPIIRIQDLTGNSYQANRYNGEYASKYEVNDGDVLELAMQETKVFPKYITDLVEAVKKLREITSYEDSSQLLLYVTFLGNVYRDNFSAGFPEGFSLSNSFFSLQLYIHLDYSKNNHYFFDHTLNHKMFYKPKQMA